MSKKIEIRPNLNGPSELSMQDALLRAKAARDLQPPYVDDGDGNLVSNPAYHKAETKVADTKRAIKDATTLPPEQNVSVEIYIKDLEAVGYESDTLGPDEWKPEDRNTI